MVAQAAGVNSAVAGGSSHRVVAGPLDTPAAPRPFGVVGGGSVLIQQKQLARHRVGEFLGAGPHCVADPLHLDLVAGGGVQQAGQLGHALADHLDVLCR